MRRHLAPPLAALVLALPLALTSACSPADPAASTEASPSAPSSDDPQPGESTTGAEMAVLARTYGRNLQSFKSSRGHYPEFTSERFRTVAGIDAEDGYKLAWSVDGSGAMTLCVADRGGAWAEYSSETRRADLRGEQGGCR